jgi:hypothetical protein
MNCYECKTNNFLELIGINLETLDPTIKGIFQCKKCGRYAFKGEH